MPLIKHEDLLNFCTAIFAGEGLSLEDARLVSDVLVEADLCGMPSHGVSRVAPYVQRLRQGGYRPGSHITVLRDFPAGAALDAAYAMGQRAAYNAMEMAVSKAAQTGVGMVSVKNCGHTGANAYYVRMAAQRGMIGLAMGNGPALVAPWGSASAVFATNPLSVGVPSAGPLPIVIDMATSVAARGKIMLAAKKGESIPSGWAVDAEGHDTTDPKAALAGVLLPFGGHKGYAVALMVEVLSGLLSGAGCGFNMEDHFFNPSAAMSNGSWFAAIDIARFVDKEEFLQQCQALINHIKGGKVRPGFDAILIPGERSQHERERQLAQGLNLGQQVTEELAKLGAEHGLNLAVA